MTISSRNNGTAVIAANSNVAETGAAVPLGLGMTGGDASCSLAVWNTEQKARIKVIHYIIIRYMQGDMCKNHSLIVGVLDGNGGVESLQTIEVEPVVSEMTSYE